MKGWLKNWEKMRHEPVAILGAGISGNGASSLLRQIRWESNMYDEHGRAFTIKEARACSFVICSPGFKPNHSWRLLAEECGKKVISEIEFASAFTNSRIIAITGTNGKTTLATFLTHLWNSLGMPALAAGNVGTSLSEIISTGLDKNKTVFLEISSFQASDLVGISPESVLWTNFDDDHLDYHGTMESYFSAKAKLLELTPRNQCFIGESVMNFADKLNFSVEGCRIINRKSINWQLPDDHFMGSFPQQENLSMAHAYAQTYNVEDSNFRDAVLSYKPEMHRLHKVDSIGRAVYWNDSKSTNCSSVLAACKNFNGNVFWIGGGKDKGGGLEAFVQKIKPLIRKAFLFGETGGRLFQLFEQAKFPGVLCDSLEHAVASTQAESATETNVLFSPGFSSFDLFKDYNERGNSFINIVLNLKKSSGISRHLIRT